jgi:type II secretory pathway pseudopilin PulG
MKSDKTMRSENTSEIVHDKNEPIKQSALSGRHVALINKIRTRRKQRGFDLIQLGLVVALIGLLMAGAMIGVPKIVENIKSNQQADDIRTFVAQSQAHFAMFNQDEVSLITANQATLYPGTALGTPTKVLATYPSRFGGKVAVSYVEDDRAMTIKIDGIPSTAVCTKMGAQLAGIASSMSVGTTRIADPGGRISMSALSTACAPTAETKDTDGKTKAGSTQKEITITTKV